MVRYMASPPPKKNNTVKPLYNDHLGDRRKLRLQRVLNRSQCMSCPPKKWQLQRSGRCRRFDCTLRTEATFLRYSSLRSMAVLSGARLSGEAANTRRAQTGGKAETKSSSSSCSRPNLLAVSLPSPALIIQRAISAPNQNRHATQASGIGESLLTCFALLSYAYPYLMTLMN